MDHRVAMATTSEEFLESFFLYFFFLSEAVPGSAIKAAGQIGCRYHCQYSRYAIQSSFHFLTKKKETRGFLSSARDDEVLLGGEYLGKTFFF